MNLPGEVVTWLLDTRCLADLIPGRRKTDSLPGRGAEFDCLGFIVFRAYAVDRSPGHGLYVSGLVVQGTGFEALGFRVKMQV